MKINAKLLVIAFIFAMIFSVSAVAASENVTVQKSELTQVPHEQVVSVAEPTVQEVETIDLETSDIKEKAQTYEITSSSDNLNGTDSNKGSLKTSKKAEPVLRASNNEDILGANTITPSGTSFRSIYDAVNSAQDGDIIDLGGLTYTGVNTDNLAISKNITIQNGIIDASNVVNGKTVRFTGVTLKDIHFTNFRYQRGNYVMVFLFTESDLENVKFSNSSNDVRAGMFTLLINVSAQNVVYDNIIAGTSVAGIRYSNLTNVNFTNSKVTDDRKDTDVGQFTVMTNSRLDNCNFINTSSNQHSGAICMGQGENTVVNSNFINCTAWVGGAIYAHGDFNENKKFTIENCSFINCHAEAEGGALGLSHNNMDVKNCVFINNTATKGAGIMVGGINYPSAIHGDNTHGHNITVDNCRFENNIASEEGGAIHISGDNNTIINSKFYYNEAPEGGAVHITGNNAVAVDSIFDDNFAIDGKGAAIYVEGDHASIDNSKFTNHKAENGTVYIEGNYFNCSDSIFDSNVASHGGAGIYVEGDDSYIYNSNFTNNNASRHGGAIHSIGDNAKILNSKFYYNDAVPSSENSDYGLGGAIYIFGDNNEVSFSTFKHNTARNGSAIYNRGGDLILNDDTFEDNQAWSYFLFTEAKPPEAYWSEDLEVLVNVTLVAGDNLINAIYNDRSVYDIYFHNVTYYMNPTDLYPTGRRTTGPDEVHPVNGVENSHGGRYLYQDAREDNQVIKVNITYDDNKVFEYEGKTNMYGNVLLSIKKENLSDGQYHPGVYNVTASHPDDTIYTAIDNSTIFRVNPHVDVSVTKTSDKDVYFVGENAVFTIKVYGVGTNATNVKVKDFLPKSFKFVDAKATQGSYDEVNNVWDIGFLPHEASHTLTLTVKTTELGTFDNVVNVTCTEKDWNLSNNVDNKTIHVDLYYTKEANVTETSAGEYIEYYIRVYNIGSTDYVETVRVHDILPEGIRYANEYKIEGADLVKYIGYPDEQIWEITNITAGTHAKITLKALAVKDGIWNNTVQVWEYPPVNATVNVTSSADLRIFKEASSEYVNKGDLVNWTVIVKNDGPSKAMDVYVNDVLPNGLEIHGTTIVSKGNYNRARGVWTIGEMDVGEVVTLTIPTRVTVSAHNITNVAIVNSSTPDPNPTNNEDNDTVYLNPDVTIEKTVSTRNTYHGQIISWNITVTNNGPNDALNVYVIDRLPAGLRFVNSTRPGNYNPVIGRWDIKTLKEGESITLIINTEVTVYEGFISNNATVYSSNDHDLDNNYDDDYTQVRTEADVGIVKLVSNQTSHHGDEVYWTIIVTNHGPNTAENVYVIDFLPNEDLIQTREPYRSKGQIYHLGDKGLWTIGSLEKGESATLIVYTKVLSTNKTIINVVNVTSSTHDPDLSNNWAENGTYVPPEADVAVVKKVDNFTPNKYDTVVWTITVVNNGPNLAENVVVRDILPSGLKFVSNSVPDIGTFTDSTNTWTIATLEVGVRHSLEITTTVIDTGKITNEVNITTSTYDTNLDNNYDNETIDVPAIADLVIAKEVSNKTPNYGDLINWTITVTNNGPNNARNVVVNDKLPKGLVYVTHNATTGLYDSIQGIWQIGDVLVGLSENIVITTRVNITNATITNVAVVTSTTPDSNETNNKANNTTDVPPVADLAVIKIVNNHNPKYGDEITWTINVTNNGPDAAINAKATDVIPNGLIYINSHASQGQYDDATHTWTIGNLTNRQSEVLEIITKVDVTKQVITNIVNVTSDTPDSDLTNNEDDSTIDVGHEADLEVIKTVSNRTPNYSDEITWTITVINHGPDAAVDVFVQDNLPKGLIYISDDGKGAYNHNTGIWDIGTLTNGNTTVLTIRTKVDLINANITNVAVVDSDTYDPNKTNNEDNDTITVNSNADLEVIKEVSNKTPKFGDLITWTVTVVNNGPNDAVNVYVNDTLPKGLIYQSDDSNGKYDNNAGIWTIGNLTNGARAVLNIKTLVNITNATITNVAVVNSTTPDNNTDNNRDNDTTDVDPEADLEIIKLVSDKVSSNGDEVIWTIVVTNNGPDVAVNTRVTDNLPAGLIYNGHKGDGIYDHVFGVWIVGDLANGESASLVINTIVNITNATIRNVAVVTSDTPDSNKTNNEANNTTAVPPEADLEVIKETSNYNHNKGDIVDWKITIINHGPDAAVNVSYGDLAQRGLVFVINGTYITGMIYVDMGITLESGESVTFFIKTLVNTTNTELVNSIAVGSDTYDPNWNNNVDDEIIKALPEANLVVVKDVSKQTVKTGETVIWTVTVTNNGPDESVNTRVIDKLPAGLIYNGHKGEGNYDPETGVWIVGDLADGESKQLVISTIANITNKTIVNVANVTSDTPGNRTPGRNNTTVVCDIADLEVVKLVSNATPNKGDEITWTIIVTNHGPDVAKGVNVTDKLPAGLKYNGHDGPGVYDSSKGIWIIGDMAKGDSVKLLIRTIVEISNGTIENIAVVNSSTQDNNTGNNKGNNSTTVNDADLVIVKVVSNKNPKFGDKITWTITVTNKGPSDAKNVRVIDKLPAGLIFNGADGNYNKDTGLWIVGDLANGESASLVINTIVNITNATIRNVANVTSDTPDSNKTNNEGNNTTDVEPEADLDIIKLVSAKNIKKGEIITWTIVVTNKGPDAAKNVYVKEELPVGLVYTVHTTSKGLFDSNSLTWYIDALANGESATLTLKTLANVSDKTLVNRVNVTNDVYDPDVTNNEANNNTTVAEELPADLKVVKVVSNKNPHKGDVITWTITVTNNGPGAAKDVTVTDKLPAGLIFKKSNGSYNKDTGVWIVGDLANGESKSLVITTMVDITNAEITNIAVVKSSTPDPNETNNKDNDTIEIDPEADIKVIKTVSNPKPAKGDVITWTIVVTNLGPDAAEDVLVEEDLPAGLKLISAKGTKGSFEDGIWTIGTLNNGEMVSLVVTTKVTAAGGTIVNIAYATSSTLDPNPSNNKDKETATPKSKPVKSSADLEITKVANVEKVKVGDKIVWTITVTNNGPNTARNVRVNDVAIGDLEYVSHMTTKGSFNPYDGVWTIGDMEDGETVVLTLECRALSAGTVINTAEVISDTPDPNKDNNKDNSTVTVVPEEPTPDNPTETPDTPVSKTPATMHATGNPVVMVLLALFAAAGVTLRRRN